jgi:hypothetical protein
MAWYSDVCLKQQVVNRISCGREGISNDHSEVVKNVHIVSIVDKNSISR